MSNKLSVILLPFKSGNRLIAERSKLVDILNVISVSIEMVIIEDGSLFGSFQISEDMEKKYNNLSAHELSRNYASHYALFAVFSLAIFL